MHAAMLTEQPRRVDAWPRYGNISVKCLPPRTQQSLVYARAFIYK